MNRIISVFFIIILVAVIFTGCIDKGQESTKVPITTQPLGPLQFKEGDIVIGNSTDYFGFLIVDTHDHQYRIDVISRKDDGSWGKRLYPDPEWVSQNEMEDGESFVIAHVLRSEVVNEYRSKEEFDIDMKYSGGHVGY